MEQHVLLVDDYKKQSVGCGSKRRYQSDVTIVYKGKADAIHAGSE